MTGCEGCRETSLLGDAEENHALFDVYEDDGMAEEHAPDEAQDLVPEDPALDENEELHTATWARSYGAGGTDRAYTVETTTDGAYVVSGYISSVQGMWIIKLDSLGNILWQKKYYSPSSPGAYAIHQTLEGGYIIAWTIGHTWGSHSNIRIMKLSQSGIVEWQAIYSGDSAYEAFSIQQTSDREYVMYGNVFSRETESYDILVMKANEGGDMLWSRTYGAAEEDYAFAAHELSDRGFIIAGYTASFGAGERDAWIIRMTEEGDIAWQKTYGGGDRDYVKSIQETTDNGFIAAGGTSSFGAGYGDFWIIKLDRNGNADWQRAYGTDAHEEATSIRQSSDGGYIVAGVADYAPGIESAFLILKLDEDGNVIWQKKYSNGLYNKAAAIRQTPDGGYIATGTTKGAGAIAEDVWVIKLDSEGMINGSCPPGMIIDSSAEATDTSMVPEDSFVVPGTTNPDIHDYPGAVAIDTLVEPEEQCSG